MKKISVSSLIVLVLIVLSTFFTKKTDEPSVLINEVVAEKVYNIDEKKEINDISYEDLNIVKISKKKFDKVLRYKEFMGAIKTVDELESIKRFSKEDVQKLKETFVDTKRNLDYKPHNINKLSKEELKYIGLNNKSINKLKDKKVKNMVELKELIGEDYKNIIGSIEF